MKFNISEAISWPVLLRDRAKSSWSRPEVKKAQRRADARREPFLPTTQSHGLCSRSQQKEAMRWLLCLLVMTLLPWGWVQAQTRNDRDGFRQQYKLILERNIFSRDRRPYVPREPRTYRPPPPIETDYCLKGITREQEQLTAFIEQLSTGIIGRYTLNAKIARGAIQAITLDQVEYVLGPVAVSNELSRGQTASDPNDPNSPTMPVDPNDPNTISAASGVKVTQVRIGQTLQGLAPGSRASSAVVFQDTTAPAATSSAPSDASADSAPLGDDESEILKRLMQRRQQELAD